MKKQKLKDERVVSEARKVYSETFAILWILLLASIIVQDLMRAPFSQFAAEFICFLGASAYLLFRNLMIGNNLIHFGSKSTKGIIKRAVAAGLIVATVNGVHRYLEYRETFIDNFNIFLISLVIAFASTGIAVFAAFHILRQLNARRLKKFEQIIFEEDC